MALTAGDIDVLKYVNPNTLSIRARHNQVEARDELVLICTQLKDARNEEPATLIVLKAGMNFENVLLAVVEHFQFAHQPRGHAQ